MLKNYRCNREENLFDNLVDIYTTNKQQLQKQNIINHQMKFVKMTKSFTERGEKVAQIFEKKKLDAPNSKKVTNIVKVKLFYF